MKQRFVVTTVAIATGILCAQNGPVEPAIEIASIKPSDPAITAMNNHFSADRFTLIGYAAQTLIQEAYSLRDYQVLNAPGWLRSDRWTLEIKTTAPTTYQQKLHLLQLLLAERLQLRVHRETRTMPVYSLVVAKGGPKLRPPSDAAHGGTRYGDQIIARRYDITRLSADLSNNLNMPVIDKTELTGLYDFDLKWTPDPNRPDFGDVHDPATIPAPDPNRPEIFTAIRQQLGLELRAEKGPVDVIVIDHVERPSPN